MKSLCHHHLPAKKFSSIFFFLVIITSYSYSQPDVSLFDYWEYHSDHKRTLYNSLTGIALKQLAERSDQIANLKSKADWEQRQTEVRVKLDQIIGEFPEKKKDAHKTEQSGYTIQPDGEIDAQWLARQHQASC